jgi:hypothetical protein
VGALTETPSTRRGRLLDLGIGLAIVLALATPALFTRDGFIDDWVNHLWLAWQQSRAIEANGLPSLFLNVHGLGVFYPNFLFYGGTLYAAAGYLIVLTGAPVGVFVAFLVAAFCAAYGGTLWCAREAGLPGLAAHIPAIMVVTGAYYLSLVYGRGSWPELVATSAIPVMVASAIRIVRQGSTPWMVVVLAIASVFWSGSHNITFAWGSIFLVALTVALVGSWAPAIGVSEVRRLGLVVAVVVLAVMVNGWFLVPDISYSARTGVAHTGLQHRISPLLGRPSLVLDPRRVRATGDPYLRSDFTELPVLTMGWVLVAAALLRPRRWRPELRRQLISLVLLTAALAVLLVDEGLWGVLPSSLRHIQFTFRLETYIVMATAGALITVLQAAREHGPQIALARRAPLPAALGAVVAFGLASGCWQVWNSDAGYYKGSRAFLRNRSAVLRYPLRTPPTWYVFGVLRSFRDASAPIVRTHGSVRLDPAKVTGSTTSQEVTIPAGRGPVASNIAAGTYIVAVHGLRVAGRTGRGYLALERPSISRARVRLTVTRARTGAMKLAPIVTVLGAAGLLCVVLAVAASRRSRRGPALRR